MKVGDRQTLVIPVYVPVKTSRTDPELHKSLRQIDRIVTETRRSQRDRVELIIAGDFNRHDQLWGGDHIGTTDRQGEAESIINLMADLDLQSLAPRGAATWHSRNDNKESTIDLILAIPELTSDVCSCTIDETGHGSDLSAIRTELEVKWQSPNARLRKLWRKARWAEVRRMVEATMRSLTEPQDCNNVDEYCEYITELVTPAIEKYVPVAKPSSYAKRWWNKDLTKLQADCTFWRNKARAGRRAATEDRYTREMAISYRKRFHDAARNQRKTHWLDFIADADNIWTVARYMDPNQDRGPTKISALKAASGPLHNKNASIA